MSQADTEELREFVEELATMARSGQSLVIVSGFHLVWWGLVVLVACIVSLVAITQALPFHDIYIWPPAMLAGWIGGRVMHKKLNLSQRKGVLAYANRVTRYVWISIGLAATFTMFAETSQFADFGGRAYFIVFLLCGIGLIATSAAGSEPLLLLSGIGWLVIAFASLLYASTATIIYSVTVIACAVFLILPGFIIGTRKA